MLWRDGDYIKFRYDLWNYYACPITEVDLAFEHLPDWFGYRGYDYALAQHLYQSFLLDYIWFLIDEGIDKQILQESGWRAFGQITESNAKARGVFARHLFKQVVSHDLA